MPMEPGDTCIDDESNPLTNNTKYKQAFTSQIQALGALLFIAMVTRPDISAAVNISSKRNKTLQEKD